MTLRITLVLLFVLSLPLPARADLTAFIGSTTTPASRAVKGAAAGISLIIVGFEFEYSSSGEDAVSSAPALRTGMGNVFVQTPFAIGGIQPYLTTGAGLYRERLGERQETSVGGNVGGGARIAVAGPLRLRLDYRVFTLRGDALHERVHRFYAGANLKF